MIDLHCHIIPYIDDGPPHYSGFIGMAKKAVNNGITRVFATPHHLNGRYENPKAVILKKVVECNQHLQIEKIPLTIHSGQEIRIHRDLLYSIEKNEVLTLDDKGKYLLLELPTMELPSYTQELVYELKLKGITPIIVHPERNREIIENQNLLYELVSEGALTQLTSGSVIGHFGKKIKSISEKIIEHHLAHFIATDAHNIRARSFTLQEAYDSITKLYGIDYTFYFKENAELIFNDQYPQIEKPEQIRKKILRFF